MRDFALMAENWENRSLAPSSRCRSPRRQQDPKAAEYASHTLHLDKGTLVEATTAAPAATLSG
ncbi:MAG: hypothetical protein ACREUL_02030 [Steroidobacteraceae bacterium]